MSKLDALREAQIWMLRDKGNRGLAINDQPAVNELPPYYWAAFVLSGDWRLHRKHLHGYRVFHPRSQILIALKFPYLEVVSCEFSARLF